jgi:hypothetical protein
LQPVPEGGAQQENPPQEKSNNQNKTHETTEP